MRDRIALLQSCFSSLKRLIVINHENCAYYKELGEKATWLFQPFHAHLSRDDMKLVAQVFARRLSHLGLALEMYYARFVEGDPASIVIDRVEGGGGDVDAPAGSVPWLRYRLVQPWRSVIRMGQTKGGRAMAQRDGAKRGEKEGRRKRLAGLR